MFVFTSTVLARRNYIIVKFSTINSILNDRIRLQANSWF